MLYTGNGGAFMFAQAAYEHKKRNCFCGGQREIAQDYFMVLLRNRSDIGIRREVLSSFWGDGGHVRVYRVDYAGS